MMKTTAAYTPLDLLLYEIEYGTQRSVAVFYAVNIKWFVQEAFKPSMRIANTAISERWGLKGLDRVKKLAWEIHADLALPAEEPAQ